MMRENSLHTEDNQAAGQQTAGFSLIELLLAMTIMAIAMLAAATMQYRSVKNTTRGNIVSQANMLAKGKIEELKNTGDLTDIDGGGAETGIDADGQPGGIYDRIWTVADMGASARRITVTVQWNRDGQIRSVTLSSNTRGNGV